MLSQWCVVTVLTTARHTEAASSTSQVLSNATVASPVRSSKCLFQEVSLTSFCMRPFSTQPQQSCDWNVVIHSRLVHESVGLSVFQYRRNLHWSKEKLERVPFSPLPKNDLCSFLRSPKDRPLYSGLRSPKTRFLHLFLSLVSSSGCPFLVVLRLTPSIFLWVLLSLVLPLVSILRFSVVFLHDTKI